MPNIQFHGLMLNLQQGFVHTNEKTVTNTVAAIFDRFKRKIVIRPEYSAYEDGFTVDTWCKTLYPSEGSDKKVSEKFFRVEN